MQWVRRSYQYVADCLNITQKWSSGHHHHHHVQHVHTIGGNSRFGVLPVCRLQELGIESLTCRPPALPPKPQPPNFLLLLHINYTSASDLHHNRNPIFAGWQGSLFTLSLKIGSNNWGFPAQSPHETGSCWRGNGIANISVHFSECRMCGFCTFSPSRVLECNSMESFQKRQHVWSRQSVAVLLQMRKGELWKVSQPDSPETVGSSCVKTVWMFSLHLPFFMWRFHISPCRDVILKFPAFFVSCVCWPPHFWMFLPVPPI